MKDEDLIKRLEKLDTPDIELASHKQALRMALLNSGHFKPRTRIGWAKVLAPVTAAVLVIAFAGFFNVIQPRLEMAQAKDIAMADVQVQELMEENDLEMTGVRLQGVEAYVLLGCQAGSTESQRDGNTLPAGEGLLSATNSTISGYILKVDLAEGKVTEFGQVEDVTDLQHVNLEDINFAKFEPPESDEPE
jgi:hypothetical protein